MNPVWQAITVVVLFAAPIPSKAPPSEPASSPSQAELHRRELAARLDASIVSVTTYIAVPEGVAFAGRWQVAEESPIPGYARERVASGFVIDGDGTILCCRSPLLLDGGGFADRFDIETRNGARFEVELLGAEPTINLAVLRVKPEPGQSLSDLVPVRVGSLSTLHVGDDLYAIGDPFGAARTFAPGVVMALPQVSCYQSDLTGSLIHGSMAVSPGALGGVLVDRGGAVMGMIVPPPAAEPNQRTEPAAFTTYGMQIQTAVAVGEALRKKRSDISPFLGISVLNLKELKAKLRDDAKFEAIVKPEFGLYIDDVFTPSPGSVAGVQVGDFVMEINGHRIQSVSDFQQSLYYFAGTQVPVRIFRNGKDINPIMKIESRPQAANRP